MKIPSIFRKKWLLYPLAAALVVVVYFLLFRKLLGVELAAWLELAVLGALALAAAITVLAILVTLALMAFSKNRSARRKNLGGQGAFLLASLALVAALILGSQLAAHTPAILNADGKPLPGSIATLEKVILGGVDQWLIVRGQDVNKPILLFLSGGPGASEAARVLRFNRELEEHFVVVIWEQRGCGKSYPSFNPPSDLTLEKYTSDVLELSEMLRSRFDERKIYLVGHSWGTIIGVRAVQQRPDLFHAYVGTAQMVDILETDQIIYDMVLDHSRKTGDNAFAQTLETQGRPPYMGKSPIKPYATLFGREYAVYEAPNIKDEDYRRNGDILELMLKQSEYGWLDRAYYLLGLMNTFNAVYPQLQDMDFRQDATQFELPVYLVLGRHDMNNPFQIPEEYFNRIAAPSKRLSFFENSGHGMIWEEAALFHSLMIDTVLPETYR